MAGIITFCAGTQEFHERNGKVTTPNHEGAAFVSLLRLYTKHKDLFRGTITHDVILGRGLVEHCSDALATMYAKCGELTKAKALLDVHKSRDLITWTALIAGYVREGQGQNALDCFECMQHEGILPNAFTYACVLKACGSLRAIDKGKEIHDEIARQRLLWDDVILGNALLDMYVKCGALSKAESVFEELPTHDLVSWNTLIAGYAQEGQLDQALNCSKQMQHAGFLPNAVTYSCIVKSCAIIGAADKGKQIHSEIVGQEILSNNIVLGTALVDMYAKCGALMEAQDVLEELPFRDVVSWSALIAGYAQEGRAEHALNCFEHMQSEFILPNAVTYACILKACATIGAAAKGKEIHDEVMRQGLLQKSLVLGNALVDMYAKSGLMSKAQYLLEELPCRDVVSWNALIAGYAQVGNSIQVLDCFECMRHDGILPDAVTFGCMLNMCSNLGIVEEGHTLFVIMNTDYDMEPDLECCTCMLDLFARAGRLEKAVQSIEEMPFSDYSAMWLGLLIACCKRENVSFGRWAFEKAVQADENTGPTYVLMANIYAASI